MTIQEMTTNIDPGLVLGVADYQEAHRLVDEIRSIHARLHEQMGQAAFTASELSAKIETAYVRQAWIPMGYKSWEELCKEEFSEARLWDSIETRRATAQQLLETVGMSTRAIAAVLGVNHSTVSRDIKALEGVADATPSKDSDSTLLEGDSFESPSKKRLGVDGVEQRKATPVELTNRRLFVAQKRAEGLSQQAIADQLGVTQRTISNDLQVIDQYEQALDAEAVERLHTGAMGEDELAEHVGFEHVSTTTATISKEVEAASRSLYDFLAYVDANLILDNNWPTASANCSETFASALTIAINKMAKWLSNEISWEHVSYDERHALSQILNSTIEELETSIQTAIPN